MTISERDWNNYVQRLSKLDKRAGDAMAKYIAKYGTEDTEGLIVYANALVTKYGEGSAELAAQMYDDLAEAEGVTVSPAEPAQPPSMAEVAKAIYRTLDSPPLMAGATSRLVKQTGADTILKNALRDGAEFAWIPGGLGCAFCLTLASRGWQKASKKAIKNGHAQHIHAHCKCNYAIRFSSKTNVAGYDPDKYLRMYEGAEGNTTSEKINSMRRAQREENKELVNAQQREAYHARKALEEAGTKKIAIDGLPKGKRHDKLDAESWYSSHIKKNFASEELLEDHYLKHAKEFGNISKQQYLGLANSLAAREPSEQVAQLVRSDGSISKYSFATNEFLVINADGTIRTYFKPEQKEAYWKIEIERNS